MQVFYCNTSPSGSPLLAASVDAVGAHVAHGNRSVLCQHPPPFHLTDAVCQRCGMYIVDGVVVFRGGCELDEPFAALLSIDLLLRIAHARGFF
jgi:hypothetical protein